MEVKLTNKTMLRRGLTMLEMIRSLAIIAVLFNRPATPIAALV